MKKIKYILAAAVAAFALSTYAFAVGDIVDDIGNGAEDIIDGAGDAADDILGGDNSGDNAGDNAGDNVGDNAGDNVGDIAGDNADLTTDTDIAAVETTVPEITTMPEITTGIAGNVVNGEQDKNAGTGVVLGFSALGAAAAGLTALAARKRK